MKLLCMIIGHFPVLDGGKMVCEHCGEVIEDDPEKVSKWLS